MFKQFQVLAAFTIGISSCVLAAPTKCINNNLNNAFRDKRYSVAAASYCSSLLNLPTAAPNNFLPSILTTIATVIPPTTTQVNTIPSIVTATSTSIITTSTFIASVNNYIRSVTYTTDTYSETDYPYSATVTITLSTFAGRNKKRDYTYAPVSVPSGLRKIINGYVMP